MKIYRKKLFFGILLAIIVAVAVGFAWHSFRYSDEEILRCTTVIEEQSYDEISIDGKPKLFVGDINSPSSLADATTIKDSLHKNRRFTVGFWINRYPLLPSCRGCIVTAGIDTSPDRITDSTVTSLVIGRLRTTFTARRDSLISITDELDYYLRVHDVQDEGFHSISQYAARLRTERQHADSVLSALKQLTDLSQLTIRRRRIYTLLYYSDRKTPHQTVAKLVRRDTRNGLVLLQTADRQTPDGICTVHLLPWRRPITPVVKSVSHPGIAFQPISAHSLHPQHIAGSCRRGRVYGFPKLLVTDGAPLFSANGTFVGIFSNGRLISRRQVSHLFEKEK